MVYGVIYRLALDNERNLLTPTSIRSAFQSHEGIGLHFVGKCLIVVMTPEVNAGEKRLVASVVL